MTTAYWCVLAAALMPYVAVSIAKSGGERFDNSNPRLWLDLPDHTDTRKPTTTGGGGLTGERRIAKPDGSAIWVAETLFPIMDDHGAVSCLIGYCEKLNSPLTSAFYYGDNISDFHVLNLVGHPVCINPDKQLKKLAKEKVLSTVLKK